MPKVHQIKIAPEYFQQVITGNKTFEIRENDRDYQTGDTVVLNEICGDGFRAARTAQFKIGYVCDYGQRDNYVVFSLLPIAQNPTELENMVDNAHSALSAVLASGEVRSSDVEEMINRGLDNKPQLPKTRLG